MKTNHIESPHTSRERTRVTHQTSYTENIVWTVNHIFFVDFPNIPLHAFRSIFIHNSETYNCEMLFIFHSHPIPLLSSPITYHKKIFVIHFLTKTGTRIQLGGQFVFPLSPPVTFLIFIYLFRVRCFVRLTCKSYKFYYPCLLLC